MKKLINISAHQFYYSTVDQLIVECSQKETFTIIIDKSNIEEFLVKGKSVVDQYVDQIIIVSEDVNIVLDQLEGAFVLLVAVVSIKEAVEIAVIGKESIRNVVCILKEEEHEVRNIIEVIVG